jgi:hypothetical protein
MASWVKFKIVISIMTVVKDSRAGEDFQGTVIKVDINEDRCQTADLQKMNKKKWKITNIKNRINHNDQNSNFNSAESLDPEFTIEGLVPGQCLGH